MYRFPRRSRSVKVVLAGLLLLPLMACSATDDDGRPTVVASFYPLQFLTEQIAGEHVRVVNLTKPGVEPHDLDPSPQQIAEISDADLVVYLDGLSPAVDKAADQNAGKQALDLAPDVDLTDDNPHFWLDPIRMEQAAVAIEARLASVDPDHAADFEANLATLSSTLKDLDAAYSAGLADCERNVVVTSHDAFGYQERYGLEFEEIAGLAPDAQPSAARIGELRDLIADKGITTVFTEALIDPAMAETLAEGDVKTAVLDPIEGIEDGSPDDYVSLMKSNLVNLEKANGCKS